jgi:hypothetical protein
VWRLPRLQVDKLSDEDLASAFQRSAYYLSQKGLEKFGEALLARSSAHQMIDPHQIYEVLVRYSPLEKSAEYAVRAQAMEREHGHSPARFMLLELQSRLQMGDGQTAKRLIDTLSTVHRNEPGVGQALMMMLVQMGILTPDGRPARGMPGGAAMPAEATAAAPAPGGLWTPGSAAPAAAGGEKKSGLWLPGQD